MKNKIITNVPGFFPIELIDYYDEFLDYYPNCELETKKWCVNNIQNSWTIIDAGANIGYYSLLFSYLAKDGLVYAFEPTETYQMLLNNLEYHKTKNVIPLKYALSNFTKKKTEKIYKIWNHDPVEEEFLFIKIDDFIETLNIPKVDLIKIDVDSYDFEVLLGAEKTIEKFNPYIIIELNNGIYLRGYNIYQVLEYLYEKGYNTFLSLDHDNILSKKGLIINSNKNINIFWD